MSDSTSSASVLQLPDYLVIGVMLLISTMIGVYYRFSGGKQRTMEEYFVADRSVGVVTLAIGLSVSFVSGVAMIGFSAETYANGMLLLMLTSGFLISIPLTTKYYLPVFNKSNTLSVYEYLKKRFGNNVRLATSIVNTVQLVLYTSIATFAPALALEETTGLSGSMSILMIGGICTFYSTLGGIKAVLITDILQAVLIIAGMVCVMVIALSEIDGGFYGAWDVASRFGRLKIFEFDPTIRHTTWNLLISGGCLYLQLYGLSQVQVQRCLTAKSLNTAVYALSISAFLTFIMMSLTTICGVILFAVYEACDPVTSGKISSFDKILPYYASHKMIQYPGATGLLIAGIFSATLSTISATINSLAVITLEDYLKPLCNKLSIELSNERATRIGKLLALFYGTASIGFAFVCKSLGSGLVNLVMGLMGLVGGPVLGVFTLGMFTEAANEIGAICGQIMAIIPLVVISSGAPHKVISLPLHVYGCDNTTLVDDVESTTMAYVSPPEEDDDVPYLYRISYTLYLPIGTFITVIVGYVASLIVNRFFPKYSITPDPDLLIPSLAKRVKREREQNSKTTNSQVFILQYREPYQGPNDRDHQDPGKRDYQGPI